MGGVAHKKPRIIAPVEPMVEKPTVTLVELKSGKSVAAFSFDGRSYDVPRLEAGVAKNSDDTETIAEINRDLIVAAFGRLDNAILDKGLKNPEDVVRKYVVDGKTINVRKLEWLKLEMLKEISANQGIGGNAITLEIPADIWGIEKDGEITTSHVFVPPFTCTESNVVPRMLELPLKKLVLKPGEKFVGRFHSHPGYHLEPTNTDLNGLMRRQSYLVDKVADLGVNVDGANARIIDKLAPATKEFMEHDYDWRMNIIAPVGRDWLVYPYDPELYDRARKNSTPELVNEESRKRVKLVLDRIEK